MARAKEQRHVEEDEDQKNGYNQQFAAICSTDVLRESILVLISHRTLVGLFHSRDFE